MSARDAITYREGAVHLLGPGDWFVGQAPGVVETLLGSCVCITLWHPGTRIGAACHIVLASITREGSAHDPRFAAPAVRLMLTGLRRRGADPSQSRAKVFGGGRMFDVDGPDIGQRNVAEAEALLAEAGIPISARDTGRNGYRRIRFDLSDGSVEMRYSQAQPLPVPERRRHG